MCTATWIRTGDGYEVFFNRDELRTRAPALPPSAREALGVRFLAPTDGDEGGAWLGVNERGLAIGLANGVWAARGDSPLRFRSRGLLVLDLLPRADLEDVAARLEAIEGAEFRPFELFAIDPRGEARLWSWDGRALAARGTAGEGTLLVSSSRDAARAREERAALLERMRREHGGLDAALLEAFHRSHEPERGAWSPCMHREEASTVSESRIRVGAEEVAFAYRPGPPCGGAELRVARLARSATS